MRKIQLLFLALMAASSCTPKASADGAQILGEASGLDPDDRKASRE